MLASYKICYIKKKIGSVYHFFFNWKMHDYFNVGKLSNGARTAQRANSMLFGSLILMAGPNRRWDIRS
jgi:hypothetical protein